MVKVAFFSILILSIVIPEIRFLILNTQEKSPVIVFWRSSRQTISPPLYRRFRRARNLTVRVPEKRCCKKCFFTYVNQNLLHVLHVTLHVIHVTNFGLHM